MFSQIITGLTGLALLAGTTYGAERVIMKPRIPVQEFAVVKAMKNPLPHTHENVAKGKKIYEGKGRCTRCHGSQGDGKGPVGLPPYPQPSQRNFHNSEWQQARSDGELKWVLDNGVQGTWMFGYREILTDNEMWQVVLYIRSFNDDKSIAYQE